MIDTSKLFSYLFKLSLLFFGLACLISGFSLNAAPLQDGTYTYSITSSPGQTGSCAGPTDDTCSHILNSITISGTTYDEYTFASGFSTTGFPLGSNVQSRIYDVQGDYVFSDPTYSTDMLTNIFSDADLNRYQQVDSNANLGFSEFFFSPGVPTTNDFYLVTTERNGNNSQFVEAFDGAVSLGMVTITANSNDYSATGAEVGFNQDSNLAVIPMSDFFDSGNPAATVTSIKITYGTTNDGPDHTTFVIGSVPLLLAEISISKDDGESTYTPGENFTYTITVTNNGPDAADGTMVADTLPTWAWAITPMWTCTASGSAVCRDGASGSGDISQTIDTFPNGGQLVYTVSGTYSTVMTDYP